MNVTALQTTPNKGTMLHQPDAVEIGPRECRLGDVAGGGPAEMALLLERGQIFEPAEEHRR